MSNTAKGADYAHITPQLVAQVRGVVDDRRRNRYSVSAIYKAHNAVFKLSETHQTCSTCLVTRSVALANWLAAYDKANAGKTAKVIALPKQGAAPTQAELDALAKAAGKGPDAIVYQLTDPDAANYLAPFNDDEVAHIREGLAATDDADFEAKLSTQLATADPDSEETARYAQLLTQVRFALPKDDDTNGAGSATILVQKLKDGVLVGEPIEAIFTPGADDASKGVLTAKDTGKAVTMGTYATSDAARVLGVQAGGKATYKQVG